MARLVLLAALAAVALAQTNPFAGQAWCKDPLGGSNTVGSDKERGAQAPYFGVQSLRRVTPALTVGCAYPQCTRIYRVTLNKEYTVQCNDYGMLPPHGVNQIDERTGCQNNEWYSTLAAQGKLKDWRNEPYKNVPEKQAAARARSSVTALTEEAGTGKATDAFPQGFHMDTLHEYYGVCLEIIGASDTTVPDRWLEIMGQAVQQDRSFCVKDWDNPNLQDSPIQEACGGGELYQCRNAGVRAAGDRLKLMFYCKENCDATDMDFYWRIMSSHQTFATNDMQEKSDNEDWCMYRRGDDYPSSLLQPYPDNYQPPPVFEGSTGSASHGRSFSFPVLVLLALLVSLVFLL